MQQRIVVKGDLDIAAAPDLLRRLDEAIDGDPGGLVIIDFDAVSFIDSTGLGVLIGARARALAANGSVVLDGVSSSLHRLLVVTGIDGLFVEPTPA